MAALQAMNIARLHSGKGRMKSSAALCLRDATACYDRGEPVYAMKRALDSLAYSVGVFHEDYARVQKAVKEVSK